MLYHSWKNDFLGAIHIPVFQYVPPLRLLGQGNQKAPRKLDFTTLRFCDLDAVFSAKVEGRLTVDDFLARRMGAILIFLRVL